MAEYIAIYKCRLCGNHVEEGHTSKRIAEKEIINVAIKGCSELVQGPTMYGAHECIDGSIGITDFQGFRKVGD